MIEGRRATPARANARRDLGRRRSASTSRETGILVRGVGGLAMRLLLAKVIERRSWAVRNDDPFWEEGVRQCHADMTQTYYGLMPMASRNRNGLASRRPIGGLAQGGIVVQRRAFARRTRGRGISGQADSWNADPSPITQLRPPFPSNDLRSRHHQ
jgi:hypothetical protein